MGKVFLIIVLILFGCSDYYRNYKEPWTDYTRKEIFKVRPITLNECYDQLDTILSKKAFSHFKNSEEKIAVIEISNQIGHSFIWLWNLNPEVSDKKPTNVRNIFYSYGISDPLEIIRIIFLTYHRRINESDYNIIYAINTYSKFWINSTRIGDYWFLNDRIMQLEDSIYNEYVFRKRQIEDTLSVSYFYAEHRFTKKPLSYSIYGVIVEMDSINFELKLKLIKIENEKDIPIWYSKKEERKIDDIIIVKPKDWYKGSEGYFRYR